MAATIVTAMQRHGVRRVVVTSMVGEGDSAANTPFYVKILLATFLRGVTPDKAKMESTVSGSELYWVITRAAGSVTYWTPAAPASASRAWRPTSLLKTLARA